MPPQAIIAKLNTGIYWDLWTAMHITGETETAITDALEELTEKFTDPLAVQYMQNANGKMFFCIVPRRRDTTRFIKYQLESNFS